MPEIQDTSVFSIIEFKKEEKCRERLVAVKGQIFRSYGPGKKLDIKCKFSVHL